MSDVTNIVIFFEVYIATGVLIELRVSRSRLIMRQFAVAGRCFYYTGAIATTSFEWYSRILGTDRCWCNKIYHIQAMELPKQDPCFNAMPGMGTVSECFLVVEGSRYILAF